MTVRRSDQRSAAEVADIDIEIDGAGERFPFEAFDSGVDIEIIESFRDWLMDAGLIDKGELPDCWRLHPGLVELLAALAMERLAVPTANAGGGGRTGVQWFLDWYALKARFSQYSDACARGHQATS